MAAEQSHALPGRSWDAKNRQNFQDILPARLLALVR